MFVNLWLRVKKRPPYFLLNARFHSDLTSHIPLFTEHHRIIRSNSGSNPNISSRLNQRMITHPALSPAHGRGAAAQSVPSVIKTMFSYELTARCYHALKTPRSRSVLSSGDTSRRQVFSLPLPGLFACPASYSPQDNGCEPVAWPCEY